MKKIYSFAFAVIMSANSYSQAPHIFKDINVGSNASDPQFLTMVNGTMYFQAKDAAHGAELWKSDGTIAGTVLVKDIASGTFGSGPTDLFNFNGTLFFVTSEVTGRELYKSDGTAAGTVLVKDINTAQFASSSPSGFTNVNGVLYFTADNGSTGSELWKTDGTTAGTVLVKDINPGINGSSAFNFVSIVDTLYFSANGGSGAKGLWKSDGTNAGTVLVKDFGLNANELTSYKGKLFFTVNTGSAGTELWTSDGTTAGTVMFKDIYPGTISSSPSHLKVVNGTLFFSATDPTNLSELWKSDGTLGGTVMVKDINPSGSSAPSNFTDVNGSLFFTAFTSATGTELWKSDGTNAGTALAKDIASGTANAFGAITPQFGAVIDSLFFIADDGVHGNELWKSNGTAIGTALLGEINAGTANGNITYLTNLNGKLFFAADDGINGNELWSLGLATTSSVTPTSTSTVTLTAPSNLTITALKAGQLNGKLTLNWTDNSNNEDGFKIERGLDGSTWTTIVSVTSATYNDTGLVDSTKYYYRVAAYKGAVLSGYSNVASETTFSGAINTGISELTANNLLIVFPNPASNKLTVYLTKIESKKAELKLYNSSGEIVLNTQISTNMETVDISQFYAGVYFLKIIDAGNSYEQRVIIQ